MDELRATPFSAGLRRVLAESVQDGEQVIWQGQPDGIARAAMWRFLWWIGFPWLVLTVIAVINDWIDQAAEPLAMLGVGMITAPFAMLLQDLQTLYVITDRRALIVRTARSRRTVTATSFDAMDAVFEILDLGGGVGHLNSASGRSTRRPIPTTPGAMAFAPRIREILADARTGKVRRSHSERTAVCTGAATLKA